MLNKKRKRSDNLNSEMNKNEQVEENEKIYPKKKKNKQTPENENKNIIEEFPSESTKKIINQIKSDTNSFVSNKNISTTNVFSYGGNFKDLLKKKIFVDKSLLIKEIFDSGAKHTLITMPRRYGKSVNLDMLKRFLEIPLDKYGNEINKKESINYKLFFKPLKDGTQLKIKDVKLDSVKLKYVVIKNVKAKKVQGKYPVIHLDFKEIRVNDFEDFCRSFKSMLLSVYKKYKYLKNTDFKEEYNENYVNIKNGDIDYLERSILNLSEILFTHHDEVVWILIDEYDAPSNKAFLKHKNEFKNNEFDKNGTFIKITEFLKTFISFSLKTNCYLYKSFITGVLNAGKHSMTSGLNIFETDSVKISNYSKYYGFTGSEVEEIVLKYNKLFCDKKKLEFKDLKKVCNGYNFGDMIGIYNPWSLTKFINFYQTQKIETLESITDPWIDSGSLDLLECSAEKNVHGILYYLEIFNKNHPEIFIDKSNEIEYEKILMGDNNTFLNVLLFTGYLTKASNNDEFVKIPNIMIKKELISRFQDMKKKNLSKSILVNNLREENTDYFFKDLKNQLEIQSSYYDFPKNNIHQESNEDRYHSLMIGIFLDYDQNIISKSNIEAGEGRADICLFFKNEKIGYIFEFKVSKNKDNLRNCAEKGLQQIKDKNYVKYFSGFGYEIRRVYLIGLAFYGKEFESRIEIKQQD